MDGGLMMMLMSGIDALANDSEREKRRLHKRFIGVLEAGVGIEPASTALQAAA